MKNLRDWLQDRGSLMARLRAHGLQPKICLLSQRWGYPNPEERHLLALEPRRHVLIREVSIQHGKLPLVHGRSIMPLATVTGPERQLLYWGERALGNYLFKHRSMTRSPFSFVSADLPDYCDQALPGRRSIFYLREKPLLLTEVFLPELVDFAHDHPASSSLRRFNALA